MIIIFHYFISDSGSDWLYFSNILENNEKLSWVDSHSGFKVLRIPKKCSILWKDCVLMTFPVTGWRRFLTHTVGIFNGCGMGPLLVLVSPCFRENVVVTCKIGSFLCSLDNLLQKSVLFSFLKIKTQNGAHLKKGLFLTNFSHSLVTREKYKKSFSTYLTHIHKCILLTLLTFFALPILRKIRIYQVWFLFGVIPRVDSYLRHFRAINKQQNGELNLSWNVYYQYVFTLMPNL